MKKENADFKRNGDGICKRVGRWTLDVIGNSFHGAFMGGVLAYSTAGPLAVPYGAIAGAVINGGVRAFGGADKAKIVRWGLETAAAVGGFQAVMSGPNIGNLMPSAVMAGLAGAATKALLLRRKKNKNEGDHTPTELPQGPKRFKDKDFATFTNWVFIAKIARLFC